MDSGVFSLGQRRPVAGRRAAATTEHQLLGGIHTEPNQAPPPRFSQKLAQAVLEEGSMSDESEDDFALPDNSVTRNTNPRRESPARGATHVPSQAQHGNTRRGHASGPSWLSQPDGTEDPDVGSRVEPMLEVKPSVSISAAERRDGSTKGERLAEDDRGLGDKEMIRSSTVANTVLTYTNVEAAHHRTRPENDTASTHPAAGTATIMTYLHAVDPPGQSASSTKFPTTGAVIVSGSEDCSALLSKATEHKKQADMNNVGLSLQSFEQFQREFHEHKEDNQGWRAELDSKMRLQMEGLHNQLADIGNFIKQQRQEEPKLSSRLVEEVQGMLHKQFEAQQRLVNDKIEQEVKRISKDLGMLQSVANESLMSNFDALQSGMRDLVESVAARHNTPQLWEDENAARMQTLIADALVDAEKTFRSVHSGREKMEHDERMHFLKEEREERARQESQYRQELLDRDADERRYRKEVYERDAGVRSDFEREERCARLQKELENREAWLEQERKRADDAMRDAVKRFSMQTKAAEDHYVRLLAHQSKEADLRHQSERTQLLAGHKAQLDHLSQKYEQLLKAQEDSHQRALQAMNLHFQNARTLEETSALLQKNVEGIANVRLVWERQESLLRAEREQCVKDREVVTRELSAHLSQQCAALERERQHLTNALVDLQVSYHSQQDHMTQQRDQFMAMLQKNEQQRNKWEREHQEWISDRARHENERSALMCSVRTTLQSFNDQRGQLDEMQQNLKDERTRWAREQRQYEASQEHNRAEFEAKVHEARKLIETEWDRLRAAEQAVRLKEEDQMIRASQLHSVALEMKQHACEVEASKAQQPAYFSIPVHQQESAVGIPNVLNAEQFIKCNDNNNKNNNAVVTSQVTYIPSQVEQKKDFIDRRIDQVLQMYPVAPLPHSVRYDPTVQSVPKGHHDPFRNRTPMSGSQIRSDHPGKKRTSFHIKPSGVQQELDRGRGPFPVSDATSTSRHLQNHSVEQSNAHQPHDHALMHAVPTCNSGQTAFLSSSSDSTAGHSSSPWITEPFTTLRPLGQLNTAGFKRGTARTCDMTSVQEHTSHVNFGDSRDDLATSFPQGAHSDPELSDTYLQDLTNIASMSRTGILSGLPETASSQDSSSSPLVIPGPRSRPMYSNSLSSTVVDVSGMIVSNPSTSQISNMTAQHSPSAADVGGSIVPLRSGAQIHKYPDMPQKHIPLPASITARTQKHPQAHSTHNSLQPELAVDSSPTTSSSSTVGSIRGDDNSTQHQQPPSVLDGKETSSDGMVRVSYAATPHGRNVPTISSSSSSGGLPNTNGTIPTPSVPGSHSSDERQTS